MRASSERPRASRLAQTVASSLARSLVVGKTLGLDETIWIMPPACLPTRGPVAGFARRLLPGLVELIQQIAEPVGHSLTDDVVVYPLEDVPEPSLVFAAQPSSGLSYRGVGLHCRLWRLSCRGFRPNRLAPRRSRPNCLLFVHLNPTRRRTPAPGSLRARQSITASKTVRSVGWNFFHAWIIYGWERHGKQREGRLANSAAGRPSATLPRCFS